jgi:hypothetical protein
VDGRGAILRASSAACSFTKATRRGSRRAASPRNDATIALRAAAMTDDRDAAVRLRAFEFLTDQRRRFGEASIPRSVPERGFDFEGVRVPLIGPPGIFKPAILPDVPLTINTAPPVERKERPYDDGFIDGGFLRYRYRGTDPNHRDNVGLRMAMQRQTRSSTCTESFRASTNRRGRSSSSRTIQTP